MNREYIIRTLGYHGQPMQKIWEDERGTDDLQKWGVGPAQLNYGVYQERQKHFTFQDRAKRLKLHQFLARKAADLYDNELAASACVMDDEERQKAQPYVAVVPPFEVFVNKNQDKFKRMRCILEAVKPGDIVYGMITKTHGTAPGMLPMFVKLFCTAEPVVRFLGDVTTKAYLDNQNVGPLPLDSSGRPRVYDAQDVICCEVLENSIDADRMYLGMVGVAPKNRHVKFGLMRESELPAYYRKAMACGQDKYEECLRKSKELHNQNYEILYSLNGLNVNDTFTHMSSLRSPFPPQDYAKALRQAQASRWAFRSVADGIGHFKNGQHLEAFACLNKALNVDPRNVEGLVARGALLANKGNFVKAIGDFEQALAINAYHSNARKYLGETLVALGHSHEEDNRIQEAAKAYTDCLNIIENHEQARLSLEAIQQRHGVLLTENPRSVPIANDVSEKRKKFSGSSSPSSGENSSGETESTSGSGQSATSDRAPRMKSESPLSRRLALHAAALETKGGANSSLYRVGKDGEDLFRGAKDFQLEEEDDTESRVRKLLQEASRHKKEKSKKSKKNKTKKSHKETSPKDEPTDSADAYANLLIENRLADIRKRQELLQQSISDATNNLCRHSDRLRRSETPPGLSTTATTLGGGGGAALKHKSYPKNAGYSHAGPSAAGAKRAAEQPKLSFQIRKPEKMDKFGMLRVASPFHAKRRPATASRSRSPSPRRRDSPLQRSRSRGRRRSRSRSRRSRTRSSSVERWRRQRRDRRSRTRSRSRNYYRRRTRSPRDRRGDTHFHPGRRSPLLRNSRRRSSRTPESRLKRSASPAKGFSRGGRGAGGGGFGNRVWKRPNYESESKTDEKQNSSSGNDKRWSNDKTEKAKIIDDGPSIEEIDEIINQAQKERKEEIIKRDKDILKRAPNERF